MKILLSKLNHLGDTLLMTPVLRFLRERYPNARIDVLVRAGCEVVLQGNPDINKLITVAKPEKSERTRREGFKHFIHAFPQLFLVRHDFAVDLSQSDRAKFWMLMSASKIRGVNDAYGVLGRRKWLVNQISNYKWAREHQVLKDFQTVLDCMDISGEAGPLRFYPNIDEAMIRPKLPFINNIKEYAVLHPTSRWAFKQWLPERWARVADQLQREFGLRVVFSCGPEAREKDMINQILMCSNENHLTTDGRIEMRELGWLLSKATLFLGVDTVAMHLAAAMQTPIVALFGPSSEWSWRPWQCRHELVLGDCECKETRQFICDKSKPYPCMKTIQVEQVLSATRRLLSSDQSNK